VTALTVASMSTDNFSTAAEVDSAAKMAQAIAATLSLLFLWVFNASGVSPGKALLGIRIVNADGSAPGAGVGLGRLVFALISGAFLGLGYLCADWDWETRTWHDKAAQTLVVTRRSK
jgi:uncharacterized RDD family membrane protein YckC